MKTAGDLVTAAAEFTAGVEHRENDLERGLARIGVYAGRYASAVVGDRAGAVFVERHVYSVAVARHSLVYRVVDYLVDEVVKTFDRRRTDIHTGTYAHRLKSF